MFILHGIVIDKLSAKEAGKQSGKLMHENWKKGRIWRGWSMRS